MFAEAQVCLSKKTAASVSELVYNAVDACFGSGKAALAFIFVLAMTSL